MIRGCRAERRGFSKGSLKKWGLAPRADTTLMQEDSSPDEKERPGMQSRWAVEDEYCRRESARRATVPPEGEKFLLCLA